MKIFRKVDLLIGAGVLLAVGAAAFGQAPAPVIAADPVKLVVTRAQLLVIGQALQELPAKIANPLLNDLQAQLNAADKDAAEIAAKKAAEAKPAEKPAETPPEK